MMTDDEYAAAVRLYDVLNMVWFRGMAPPEERAVGCPRAVEIGAALNDARVLLMADPRWLRARKVVLRDGMLVNVPASEVWR